MKKKIIIASVLGALCCSFCSVAFLKSDTRVSAATLENIEFNSEYTLHSQIEIPESKITYQDEEHDANVKVIKPNGNAIAVDGGILDADQVGVYKVIYYTVVNGNYVSVERNFTVSNRSVSFSGEKSSYFYGSHEKYATTSGKYSDVGEKEELKGLVVSLAQGETMYYNPIIDLNQLTGRQVFSMFTTPQEEPLADATVILFRFTDIYDPTNYVVVRAKANGTEAATNNRIYCDVKASVHSWHAGMEPFNGDAAVSIAGGSYAVTADSIEYGSPITYSLGGYVGSTTCIGDIQYGVEFDLTTNFVYSKTELQKCPIADLDHPLCFDTPWEGFTTGEVFLSVSASGYNASNVGIVFTDIAGHDLETADFHTEKAPLVQADLGEYNETAVPNAFVGEKYKLFPADAYDVYDGELSPIVKVFYGYHSTNATRIGIENGCFTPNRKGIYTIEYSAVNAKGIRSVYTVDVEAVESDEHLGISIFGKTETVGIGQKAKIIESYELTNVAGNGKTVITATLNGNKNVRYVIGEDLIFQPRYAGEYTVLIEYSDYLFAKTESFTCIVTVEGGSPLINDTPKLPNYLIKGKSYTIPELFGYEFTTGEPKEKICEVYIEEEGKARRPLTDKVYTPTDGEKVSLVYVVSDGTASAEERFELKIVDTMKSGMLDTATYFASETGTAIAKTDSVLLETTEDGSWEFINLLVARKVEWRLRTLQGATNYGYLDFYLQDAVQPNKTVEISLTRNGDLLDVFVNGVNKATMPSSFSSFASSDLSVTYDGDFSLISINNATQITVDTYADGTKFEGFTSGSVVFKVGVSDVSGDAKIAFRKINNQNIRALSVDKTAPLVYYTMHRGYQTIGDTITFDAAYAGDVLDPCVTLKYYVIDQDGNYIVANDGTKLDGTQATDKVYEYTIKKIGTFEVLYEVEDSSGQNEEYSYVIHSVDTIAPNIQLTGGNRSGKAGDKITIATAKISDDFGATESYVFVIFPNGRIEQVIGKSFVATEKGTYTVQFLAFDTNGNIVVESYDVLIS